MSTKAVLITTANTNKLMTDYDLEEDVIKDAVGLYLVADFAAKTPTYGYLTEEKLKENFKLVLGRKKLENDFFQVEPKW